MKEAFYFSHDSNARSDPKIKSLVKNHGMQGYGRYWVIVETLREQSDFKLEHAEWVLDALAMDMLCDTNAVALFIDECVNRFKLLTSDNEKFWSNSLIRRMEKREEDRQKRAEAGKKGAEKRWQGHSNAMAELCDTNAEPMANDSKESKVNESKGKGKRKDYISLPNIEYVFLTQAQYDNVVSIYGKRETDRMIFELNHWKGSRGGKSKDDNLTLQNWLRRDKEKKDKPHDGPLGVKCMTTEPLIRREDW